jgi:hypothetical protein
MSEFNLVDYEPEKAAETEASARRRAAEAEVDRLLGSLALIHISDVQKYGGPSPPTVYHAENAGLIELVRNGKRTSLTRVALKSILLDGFGELSFFYGAQGEKKKKAEDKLILARLTDAKKRRRVIATDADPNNAVHTVKRRRHVA